VNLALIVQSLLALYGFGERSRHSRRRPGPIM